MMEFRLIDVKSIMSNVPRSNFEETELAQLADLILECEGVLKPPVLKVVGLDSYEVIQGDREYYAAVIAREKNPRHGEMINAFVVLPKHEGVIRRQLEVLRGGESLSTSPSLSSSLPLPPEPQPLMEILQRMERSFQSQLEGIKQRVENMEVLYRSQNQPEEKLWQRISSVETLAKEIIGILQSPPPSQTISLPRNPAKKLGIPGCDKRNMTELKELARKHGISGFSSMRKPALCKALMDAGVDLS